MERRREAETAQRVAAAAEPEKVEPSVEEEPETVQPDPAEVEAEPEKVEPATDAPAEEPETVQPEPSEAEIPVALSELDWDALSFLEEKYHAEGNLPAWEAVVAEVQRRNDLEVAAGTEAKLVMTTFEDGTVLYNEPPKEEPETVQPEADQVEAEPELALPEPADVGDDAQNVDNDAQNADTDAEKADLDAPTSEKAEENAPVRSKRGRKNQTAMAA